MFLALCAASLLLLTSSAQPPQDPAKAVRAIFNEVGPLIKDNHVDTAIEKLHHAIELAVEAKDGNLVAQSCIYLGIADLVKGNEQEAQKAYEDAVTLLQGSDQFLFETLQAAVSTSRKYKRHDSEIRFLQMLADAYGHQANTRAQADTLENLLEAYDQNTEMHALCDTLDRQLMPLYEKLNNPADLAQAWAAEGKCREKSNDFPAALTDYKRSIDALRALNDKSTLAAVLNTTAESLRVRGRAAEALPLQKESVALRKELAVPTDYAQSLNDLAMTDQDLGFPADALTAIEESVRITRTLDNPDSLSTSLTNQAAVYRDLGRIDDALKSLDESLTVARNACLTERAKDAMKIMATVYVVTGDAVKAAAAEAVAGGNLDICANKKKSEIPSGALPSLRAEARFIPASLVNTRRFSQSDYAFQAPSQALSQATPQSPSQPPSWIITDEKGPAESARYLLESASVRLADKKIDEAIDLLNQALQFAQTSQNDALIASAYIRIGNAQLQKGNETLARTALDNGVEILQSSGNLNDVAKTWQMAIDLARENKLPATQSRYLEKLAALYRDTEKLDEAQAAIEQSVQVARDACLTEQARSSMKVMATIDSAMGKAGKAAEGEALANDTKDICPDKTDKSPQAAANPDEDKSASKAEPEPAYMSTHNMSLTMVQLGGYSRAIENFKAEIKNAEADHDPAASVSAHEGLAYAYAESSQYTLAESSLIEAENIERGLGNPRAAARIQSSLANVYLQMGRYYDALDLYSQIEKTSASLQDISLQINTLLSIGELCRQLKNYESAHDKAQAALSLSQNTGLRNLTSKAQQDLGLVELARENYASAGSWFRESAKNSPENAVLNDGLVEVYLGTGRFEEAEKELGRASTDDLASADSSYRLQYFTQRGIARLGLNRYTDAVSDFNSAIAEAEQLRTQVLGLKSTGFLDAGSFGGRVRPYRGMVETFGSLAVAGIQVNATIDETPTDAPHAAFHFAELTRGRSLVERLAVSHFDELRKQVPQSVLDEGDRLINQAMQLAVQVNQASGKQSLTPQQNEQFAQLRAQTRAYLDNLQKNYPLYARAFSPGTIPVDDLPLARDEALLEYAIGINNVFVFVVSSDHSLRCYRLSATPRQIQAKVRVFRNLIAAQRFSPAIAHDLFTVLLGSIPGYEQLPRNLIIVPDSFLALLPFEALNTASTGDPSFLDVDHSILYAQSASVLVWTRQFKRAATQRLLFAVADPIFTSSDPRIINTALAPQNTLQKDRNAARSPALFRRLPETQTEVDTLASILGVEARPPDVLVGAEASKQSLQKSDLAAYRYLHFATHAVALGDPGVINEPFLVLRQVGNAPDDNGLLTMSEIMDLKLNSDLVVLSACDTGEGDVLEGDGVASLASAFQFAGAQSVVLSLWEVPSEAAVSFMRTFYQELKLGHSKAEALRSGRQATRRLYPNPYYWADFILYSGAAS
jgi:CHAT domain-containing protein